MTKAIQPFEVSSTIISHLIESQAGTLHKAILEGVMNAFDAEATRVSVNFDKRDKVTIEDDGHGFRTEAEVRKHFGVFGFDHSSPEERALGRKLGRFGLGRGQIMAFGSTVWETNAFEMHVDIRTTGLGFRLECPERAPIKGCRITATLYEPLKRTELQNIIDEIGRNVRYASIPVSIDGTLVSRDPAKETWSTETEHFWFRARPDSERGVDVYSLGMYVRTYGHYTMGVSGELVSKPGHPFTVNTARNDILEGKCTVWKHARKLLRSETGRRRESGHLSESDRIAIVNELRAGGGHPAEMARIGLLKTVGGRYLSVNALCRQFNAKLTIAPKARSPVGERIHDAKLAATLAPQTLDWYQAAHGQALAETLNHIFENVIARTGQPIGALEFDPLAEAFADETVPIDRAQWTRTETAAIPALEALGDAARATLAHALGRTGDAETVAKRRLMIGSSGSTSAWTDGVSFIAIERRFLAWQMRRGADGWTTLLHHLVHEYTHGDASSAAHSHGPEFYIKVHDTLLDPNGEGFSAVTKAMDIYAAQRAKANLATQRVTARTLDEAEHLANRAAASGAEDEYEALCKALAHYWAKVKTLDRADADGEETPPSQPGNGAKDPRTKGNGASAGNGSKPPHNANSATAKTSAPTPGTPVEAGSEAAPHTAPSLAEALDALGGA